MTATDSGMECSNFLAQAFESLASAPPCTTILRMSGLAKPISCKRNEHKRNAETLLKKYRLLLFLFKRLLLHKTKTPFKRSIIIRQLVDLALVTVNIHDETDIGKGG